MRTVLITKARRGPARPRHARQQGLSLVEVGVSLSVFSILLVSVFSIAVETSNFIGDTDVDHSVRTEVGRVYGRLSEVLRKSGWNELGAVEYPRVTKGGKELEFRLLRDLDGNGHAFDSSTGQLEWSPTIYSVRLDGTTGVLAVYDDQDQVFLLGRHIEDVDFATYIQDNSLHLKEIQVSITASRTTRRGDVDRKSVV